MKRRALAGLLLVLLAARPLAAQDHCVVCHAELGEKHEAILRDFEGDIHRQKGLSCHSCHGGDPSKPDFADAKDASFVGVPTRAEIPGFCGRCHSKPEYMKAFNPSLPVDQELKYFTSVHGQRLKKGDASVATCADCHRVHAIKPAKDPTSTVHPRNVPETCGRCHSDPARMGPYNLPTDQLAKYSGSVHGKALLERGDTAAPACNTCHSNHGAVPPGVENIGHVCGMCHATNEEFFKTSPMAGPWKTNKLHMCATCHNHHDIQHPTAELISTETGLCKKCHTSASAAGQVSRTMKEKLDAVEGSYRDADQAIGQAAAKGMDTTEARDLLDEARTSLYQARTSVHTFRAETVAERAGQGVALAGKAKQSALAAIKEFNWRRLGLGVSSLLITLLLILVYLKIRDIESRPKDE